MNKTAIGRSDAKAFHKVLSMLEAAKHTTDGIFDYLPVVFIMSDEVGRIVKINRFASTCFNQSIEDLLGKTIGSLFADETQEQFSHFLMGDETGRMLEFEAPFITQEGHTRFFFWQLTHLEIVDNSSIYIFLGTDTTELKRTHESLKIIEKDLEISQLVQEMLIPQKNEFKTDFFDLAAYYQPANKVGGDWWWCDTYQDQCFAIVGDVSGHGVGPAMVTAAMAGAHHSGKLVCSKNNIKWGMADYLDNMSQTFMDLCAKLHWMTVTGIEFKKDSLDIKLYFAGSPSAIIFRRDGDKEFIMQGSNPFGNVGFEKKPLIVPFRPGDRLFICTDGAYELCQNESQDFNLRRLSNLIVAQGNLPVKEIIKNVAVKLNSFTGIEEDDVTMLLIERK